MAWNPAARNLDDDCAVLEIGDTALVITHDAMAEGLHFLPDQDPADVAWKLVASNVSDLAAKGADPLGVMLGYQFGNDDLRFLDGFKEALGAFELILLGGDSISSTGAQVLGLTAIGLATHRPVPSRAGAKPGDTLWITGPVGAAMMGLEALQTGKGDSTAYRRPGALVGEGMALAPHVSAIMDVSDGLLLDAARMARASGVTLAIDSEAVPLAAPEERRDEALRWGEDYQLLFALPPGATPPIEASRIGQARKASTAPILLDGALLSEADGLGYGHS